MNIVDCVVLSVILANAGTVDTVDDRVIVHDEIDPND